jgi:cyclopropane fatty-acyl-phospholipid synthase-like methyltransferase
MSKEKLNKLYSLLDLKPGSKVLDIACGKGEALLQLAELYEISGIGVDISPYFIKSCREAKKKRFPDQDIEFIEIDGADYKCEDGNLFDLSLCVGASWIYKGYKGTIDALKKMTKPGGLIIIGEPYWLKEPDTRYLKMLGTEKDVYGSHYGNIDIGEKSGLQCLFTLVSNHDDWDYYETLQWWSALEYISKNPNDKDNNELLKRINKAKKEYLLYGRDTVNWAIYVFMKQ